MLKQYPTGTKTVFVAPRIVPLSASGHTDTYLAGKLCSKYILKVELVSLEVG